METYISNTEVDKIIDVINKIFIYNESINGLTKLKLNRMLGKLSPIHESYTISLKSFVDEKGEKKLEDVKENETAKDIFNNEEDIKEFLRLQNDFNHITFSSGLEEEQYKTLDIPREVNVYFLELLSEFGKRTEQDVLDIKRQSVFTDGTKMYPDLQDKTEDIE